MITKHFSKIRSLFKFILLFGAIAFLSYCTSSPKTASNFGKRKYTKGHFADHVAKVKMEYTPYDERSVAPTVHANHSENSDNIATTKHSDKKDINQNFTAKATTAVTPFGNQPKQPAIAIANRPAETTNNVSLKENSTVSAYPYAEQGHPYQHGGGDNSSGLLLAWVLALAVSVLCYLLLIAYATSAAAGSATAGVGCFLVIFGTFAFVAAVVLFILWVVALSR